MKKILFSFFAFFLIASFSYGQQGNNQIGVGAEANFLLGSSYSSAYGMGFGGDLKGLYGVGATGQLTLTGGYSSYSGKSGTVFSGQTLSLLPILAGYRYNTTGGFYGEAQAGAGILTTRGSGYSFSQTNFGGAINLGYEKNGFDVSVRYYTEGDVVSSFAVRLGYNFSLKSK